MMMMTTVNYFQWRILDREVSLKGSELYSHILEGNDSLMNYHSLTYVEIETTIKVIVSNAYLRVEFMLCNNKHCTCRHFIFSVLVLYMANLDWTQPCWHELQNTPRLEDRRQSNACHNMFSVINQQMNILVTYTAWEIPLNVNPALL
jgi:hypothetical protein